MSKNKPLLDTIISYLPGIFRGWNNTFIPGSSNPVNPNQANYTITDEQASINKLPARISNAINSFNFQNNRDIWTNQKGSSFPSPIAEISNRQFIELLQRRDLLFQIRKMRDDDPMLTTGINMLGDGAVGDGCKLIPNYQGLVSQRQEAKTFQWITEALKLMTPSFASWCKDNFVDGDAYIQTVATKDGKPHKYVKMPTAGMERFCNTQDQFDNPSKAYKQTDTLTTGVIETDFSDFDIVHSRWDRQDNEKYGRSKLFAARQSSIDSVAGFAELIIRRSNSTPIQVHKFLKPVSANVLSRYIYGPPGRPDLAIMQERIKMGDRRARSSWSNYAIANGTDIKIEQADAHLNEIDDLMAMVDRALAVLCVPLALITGKAANYATAQALMALLYGVQRILAKQFEHLVIRPLIDRVILLSGTLPDFIEYELDWGQKFTSDEALKIVTIFLEIWKEGGISLKDFLDIQCQVLQRKDADQMYERVLADRKNGIYPLTTLTAMMSAKQPDQVSKPTKNLSASLYDPNIPEVQDILTATANQFRSNYSKPLVMKSYEQIVDELSSGTLTV